MAITIPSFPQDRGTAEFDPTTKSNRTKPQSYCETICFTNPDGTCAAVDYRTTKIAMTVNELENCVPQMAASASISLRLDVAKATTADIAALVDNLRGQIDAVAAEACAAIAI